MRPPVLVLGWGNLSRGDDALGPLALAATERLTSLTEGYVECLTDFQLQVEYALDVCGRDRVLFVDAARSGPEPFAATRLEAAWDPTYTTHELSPAAVLHTARTVVGEEPPPAWLLGIRGYSWELGEEPTPRALDNLAAALDWLVRWLVDPLAAPTTPARVHAAAGTGAAAGAGGA